MRGLGWEGFRSWRGMPNSAGAWWQLRNWATIEGLAFDFDHTMEGTCKDLHNL